MCSARGQRNQRYFFCFFFHPPTFVCVSRLLYHSRRRPSVSHCVLARTHTNALEWLSRAHHLRLVEQIELRASFLRGHSEISSAALQCAATTHKRARTHTHTLIDSYPSAKPLGCDVFLLLDALSCGADRVGNGTRCAQLHQCHDARAHSLPYICDCGDARAVAKSIEQKKKQMKNSIQTNILVYTYKNKRKHNNEPANGIDLIMMAHCTAALSLTLPTWHCIF